MPLLRSVLFVSLTALVVVILFLLIDYMAVSKSSSMTSVEQRLEVEFAATWLFKIAGGFIATVAALALLIRSLDREPLAALLPFVLPLLGGILLAATHWSVAIALGLVVLGLTGREIVGALPARRGPQ